MGSLSMSNEYKQHLINVLNRRGYSNFANALKKIRLLTVSGQNASVQTAAASGSASVIILNTDLNLDQIKITITHEILHIVEAHIKRQVEQTQQDNYTNAFKDDAKKFLKQSHHTVGNIVGDVHLATYQSPSDRQRILTFAKDSRADQASSSKLNDLLEIGRGLIGELDINGWDDIPAAERQDFEALLKHYENNLNISDSAALQNDFKKA